MNGKASELYSWGPPKFKSELRLLQKKKTIYSFVHPTVFYVQNLQFDILSMMQENLMVLALSFCVAREITLN